jgi:hypothetical protein
MAGCFVFSAVPRSYLPHAVAANIEDLYDVVGCQCKHGINFSKFAEENDLTIARFEDLPFAAVQQGAYILGCQASST